MLQVVRSHATFDLVVVSVPIAYIYPPYPLYIPARQHKNRSFAVIGFVSTMIAPVLVISIVTLQVDAEHVYLYEWHETYC